MTWWEWTYAGRPLRPLPATRRCASSTERPIYSVNLANSKPWPNSARSGYTASWRTPTTRDPALSLEIGVQDILQKHSLTGEKSPVQSDRMSHDIEKPTAVVIIKRD